MALDFLYLKDGEGNLQKIVGKKDASDRFQQGFLLVGSRGSATFTTVVAGATVDVSDTPMGRFSLQVRETGTVASWTVVLEYSVDGVIFRTLMTHTKAANENGGIVSSGPNYHPASYLRLRCTALSLSGGTNVIATFQGMP